jgi:hypothetical protein
MHQTGFKITAVVNVQLSRYLEAAGEGFLNFLGCGVKLSPLGTLLYKQKKVVIGASDISGSY